MEYVKGGYQTVDLSNANITGEELKKVFESSNGKPVLIKVSEDSESFGVLVEQNGSYNLSYLDGNGTVNRLTLAADLSYTNEASTFVPDSTFLSKTQGVSLVNTTINEPYITPSDGYVFINFLSAYVTTARLNNGVSVGVLRESGSSVTAAAQARIISDGNGGAVSISGNGFVRKGSKICWTNSTGSASSSDISCSFFGLIAED